MQSLGLLRSGIARGLRSSIVPFRSSGLFQLSTTSTLLSRTQYSQPIKQRLFATQNTDSTNNANNNKKPEEDPKPDKQREIDEKKQAEFLKSLKDLNEQNEHKTVLEQVEASPAMLQTPEVVDEYVKALVARKAAGEDDLNRLISRALQEPGRSVGNPIYIAKLPKSLWERLLYPALFIIFILYLWRGGPLSGFSGKVGEYNTASKQHIGFNEVKGNDEAKEEMSDLVEYLKNPKKFLDLGVKMPKGVLLMGPPGTGKTLMARALAGEAGVPFFYTSGSEFEEMLVGVGAMRIRNLFAHARSHAPCIIFIDEIDAVGGRRDSTETKTKMTLNQLLVELDGFATSHGVLVVAATNLPEVLDPALVRPGRFDRQVHLELPDKKTRHEILEMYLKDKLGDDVNLEVLSRHTSGLSGADLFNVANWAAIEAIKLGQSKVTQQMLENSLENSIMGRQRKSLIISDSTKKLTAFHEAGHALVALHTPGAHPIHKATLVPRGHALGMVQQLANDDLMYTREELLAGLDVAMGGRAAEELIFGPNKVTQGAGSDFQQATRKAKAMVTKLGMSDAIGKVYLDKNDGDISPATQGLVDTEVRKLLDASFDRAQKLLGAHSVELHRLADALLEHETLTLEDIQLVVAGKPLPPKPLPTPQFPSINLLADPTPITPDVVTVPIIPIPVVPSPSAAPAASLTIPTPSAIANTTLAPPPLQPSPPQFVPTEETTPSVS